MVRGKRKPPDGKWFVQFRCGFVDQRTAYEPAQLRWIHDGSDWDVVAVMSADDSEKRVAWNPKSGGY